MSAPMGSLPTSLSQLVLDDLPTPTSRADDDYDPNSLAYDLIRFTPAPTVILDALLYVRHVSDSLVQPVNMIV